MELSLFLINCSVFPVEIWQFIENETLILYIFIFQRSICILIMRLFSIPQYKQVHLQNVVQIDKA